MEKCRWSTQVKVCVARNTQFVKHGDCQTSSGVKVETQTIVGPRPAVQYSTAVVRQQLHEITRLLRKRMVESVASPEQPPNLPCRLFRRQCMKHRKHRRRSDTSAKQDDGPITRLKGKTAPRCAHVQYVADPEIFMHVGTGNTVYLLLNAHAIVVCTWRVRERVTPQHRRQIRVRPQAQHDKLARLGSN